MLMGPPISPPFQDLWSYEGLAQVRELDAGMVESMQTESSAADWHKKGVEVRQATWGGGLLRTETGGADAVLEKTVEIDGESICCVSS